MPGFMLGYAHGLSGATGFAPTRGASRAAGCEPSAAPIAGSSTSIQHRAVANAARIRRDTGRRRSSLPSPAQTAVEDPPPVPSGAVAESGNASTPIGPVGRVDPPEACRAGPAAQPLARGAQQRPGSRRARGRGRTATHVAALTVRVDSVSYAT
jgi:hypothetical protein